LAQAYGEFGVLKGQNLSGEDASVGRPGFANGDRSDWHTLGHLDRGQQCIQPL
jgi:hypothetical protein